MPRTKKHPTETIHRLDTIAGAAEISPELHSNSVGVYLRGIRLREELSQEELAKLAGISRSNISAMEHGKRPIGKETAKRLAGILKCDYRRFL